jgi:hypothetical protein
MRKYRLQRFLIILGHFIYFFTNVLTNTKLYKILKSVSRSLFSKRVYIYLLWAVNVPEKSGLQHLLLHTEGLGQGVQKVLFTNDQRALSVQVTTTTVSITVSYLVLCSAPAKSDPAEQNHRGENPQHVAGQDAKAGKTGAEPGQLGGALACRWLKLVRVGMAGRGLGLRVWKAGEKAGQRSTLGPEAMGE